jgi:hypothetical protein
MAGARADPSSSSKTGQRSGVRYRPEKALASVGVPRQRLASILDPLPFRPLIGRQLVQKISLPFHTGMSCS